MKQIIKNRKGENISILIEKVENQKGLAFVMHGLGGFKEQNHIRTFIKAFLYNQISVVSFDTTNTFGESDGNYENATVTNYYEDLEDVIEWSQNQKFYQKPFYLSGHSLGGICTTLYTQKYPELIKALAPISPVVSGQLSLDFKPKEDIEKWKNNGYKIEESKSKPGLIKKLKWNHMKDRLKYNLLDKVNVLTMPVLIIVGENDDTTPVIHQKILYKKIPGEKELHIIKGAPHTFREEHELSEIYNIINEWIKKY